MTSEQQLHDDLVGAGISPKERLERIEQVLARIDSKLDGKADVAIVIAMDTRISQLEKQQIELRMAARANEERVLEARSVADAVREGQATIATRIAWAGGAVAAALFIGDALLRFFAK